MNKLTCSNNVMQEFGLNKFSSSVKTNERKKCTTCMFSLGHTVKFRMLTTYPFLSNTSPSLSNLIRCLKLVEGGQR